MALRQSHRWKAAARRFAKAIEADQSFAEAEFWLAASLDAAGQGSEAIPHYQRALLLSIPDELRSRALTWLASSLSRPVGTRMRFKALSDADLASRANRTRQ